MLVLCEVPGDDSYNEYVLANSHDEGGDPQEVEEGIPHVALLLIRPVVCVVVIIDDLKIKQSDLYILSLDFSTAHQEKKEIDREGDPNHDNQDTNKGHDDHSHVAGDDLRRCLEDTNRDLDRVVHAADAK